MRLFIWVQHLFGLGHVRRMARIAEACAAEGFTVTLAAGGPGGRGAFRRLTNVTTHQLPPLKTSDHQYTGLLTETGDAPGEAYWALRREALTHALTEAKPDIVLIELFPFGRRKFASEVLDLIARAKVLPSRPLIVSSVRDIVEPKAEPEKTAQMADWLEQYFDAVLVHGDAKVVGLETSAPFVRESAVPVQYTGYIAPERGPAQTKAGVVVSAGSGASGATLLAVAAKAGADHALPARPWHLFVPRNVEPPASDHPHVRIHPFTDEFPNYLARAEVSVGEAGYNTTCEALALGARPVLVPYAEAGQSEQPARAAALARAGLAVRLPARELSPDALLEAIEAARHLPVPTGLNLSGAEHTPVILKALRESADAP